jgi:hypothetical protein
MSLVLLSSLQVLLAAAPSVAVTLSRRTAVSTADASAVTTQVAKALEGAGVPLLDAAETSRRLSRVRQKDATLCAGKPACLKELLKSLEVPWLVLVSVAQVAGDKSLGLELFERDSGTVVEVESVVLPSWKAISPDLLEAFAQRVEKRAGPAEAPKVGDGTKPGDATKNGDPTKPGDATKPDPTKPDATKPGDAPVATTLTPTEATATDTLPPAKPSKPHVTSWVLGGLGAAALVTAGVLLGLGLSSYASLSAGAPQPDGTVQSELTGAEAQARASSAGMQIGIGSGAAAVAVVLGTTAVIAW